MDRRQRIRTPARLPEAERVLGAGDIVHVTATLEGAGQLGRRLEGAEA